MTDKAETALDLDELAASGFTAGPWRLGCSLQKIFTNYRTDEDMIGGGWGKSVAKTTEPKWMGIEQSVANGHLIASAPSLLELAIKQRDEIAVKEARIAELEDVIEYLKISDNDASLIRGLLDVTDVWDNHDKAIDRMLSCFPNDPLNARRQDLQKGKPNE